MEAAVDLNRRIGETLRRLQDEAKAENAQDLHQDFDKMLRACAELATFLEKLPERMVDADEDQLRVLRHDLRTPVGQILGYCELMQEEAEDEGGDRWLAPLDALKADAVALRQAVDALGSELATPRPKVRSFGSTRPRADAQASGASSRPTILIIDDNPANRDLLARLLQRDGFEVLSAGEGAKGIELAQTGAADLVLLDIVMPGMDGYEVLEHLMRDDVLRNLPVIMLTSLDERESITRCIEAGAWDHVPKPFDAVILRARINSALERKLARDKEREYLAQIVAEKKRVDELIHGVIPIGVALTSERDEAKLLERILREARRFCGAEGGVLYLRTQGRLVPMQIQVDALQMSGTPERSAAEVFERADSGRPTPARQASTTKEPVHVPDVTHDDRFDVSYAAAFDERHGFCTQSLLSLPLQRGGEVLGVLELWNAKSAIDDVVTAFAPETVEILSSLSSLAAAALDGYRRESDLRQQIRRLEIRVDSNKRQRQVSAITETDYFKQLRDKARELRKATR